tara:strand:- start:6900 stop:7955 length:1056 start_codon:yes stop_codon:yes gene_type:complete
MAGLEEFREVIESGDDLFQKTLSNETVRGGVWCGVSFFKCRFELCEFVDVDFREAVFMEAQFVSCKFVECNLTNVRILKSEIAGCELLNPSLTGLQCMQSKLDNSVVSNTKINGAQLMDVDIRKTVFREIDWERVNVMHGAVEETRFEVGTIKNSCFIDCGLEGTAFEKIEFDEFLFQGGNLSGHDWSGMTLTKVQFYDVHSRGAKFCNAQTWHVGIHESDFSGSDFRSLDGEFLRVYKTSVEGACFEAANLNNSQFTESCMVKANFRGAKMAKSMVMDCDATHADFDTVDFKMGEMVKTLVKGSRLTYIDCKLSKFDTLIEDDDTDWTGTVRTLARPEDAERKEKLGASQ